MIPMLGMIQMTYRILCSVLQHFTTVLQQGSMTDDTDHADNTDETDYTVDTDDKDNLFGGI